METVHSIGFIMGKLLLEAQRRWLKPSEILFLLQNVREHHYSQKPLSKPSSGSIFFYNKRVVRNFRQDGHAWRKKKDGKTVGEAHEKLKVGNVDALNCYYAHGEHNSYFQRRSYWMLNSKYDNVVLVHYLDVAEGRHPVSLTAHSGLSSNNANINMASQCFSSRSGSHEEWAYYDNSCSPGYAAEVDSDSSVRNNQIEYPDIRNPESTAIASSTLALRKLAAQLSLEDYDEHEENPPEQSSHPSSYEEAEWRNHKSDNSLQMLEYLTDSNRVADPQFSSIVSKNSASGQIDVRSSCADLREKDYTSWNDRLELAAIGRNTHPAPFEGDSHLTSRDANNFSGRILNGDVLNENVLFPSLDEANCWNFLEASCHKATVADIKNFSIREISPDWAYSTGNTKVIIIGDFLHAPERPWAVMFGDIEVPAETIQPGVLCCWAPQHLPGSVKLCVTSGKHEACSEFTEFSYLMKPDSTRSTGELLLLVKFVETVLNEFGSTDVSVQDAIDPELDQLRKQRTRSDRLDQLLEAVLVSSESPSKIVDLLLEELLRDKLPQWLEQRKQDGKIMDSSSKQEFSIIHILSGLGYEWALKPVIDSGIGVNFRDVRGWTALHWAARFGREKMVATLLAAGALAGAVTDPTQQDPLGKTPASIAAEHGHKGLAGYLAEVALTSHLSSLTIGESEISRACAHEEANKAVQNISEKIINSNFAATEDQLSLEDSLGAVMNATQAAARIQSAFHAYSFRKKQQTLVACPDEYGMIPGQIHDAMLKHHKRSHSARDHKFQVAALCIQKKFRGWQGRKTFLNMRKNVVKIQAHVRGHQVRKKYRFSMTVSILEKAILRWRRRGVGLRGCQVESESGKVDDNVEVEEEAIIKVFRKQKVDGTVKAAVSRVLSMVESPEARQQYSRMLESYQQAKAELHDSGTSALDDCNQMDETIDTLYHPETDNDWTNFGYSS